ncbi:phage portal protein [Massilia sp. Root351]|uniref:phage portal protein n=1 Tax=Massilia sp. Root351 TaxID=1736522 RepID=UPI001E58D800|nr:phage portal protein [Massilia sp. Root351]
MYKAAMWLKKSIAGAVQTLQPTVGGTYSLSGQNVNTQSAMQIATVWACIRLISETIATLPVGVFERDKAGRRKAIRDHWLYSLVHDQPNANMTAVEFWEAVVAQICLWGNCYCLKSYSGGRLVSIDPLQPDQMKVETNERGELVYKYKTKTGVVPYTEDQIFHIKGFGITGLIGLSPISYARNSLGAAMSADEASGKLFANGMRAGGSISFPAVLTKTQRKEIREDMVENLAGTAKAGKIMVLEGGSTYQPLTMNPDDAQMLQTRAFNVEEICRWFRVPPFMVGHSEKSTSWGTGLEQQMIGFLTFALRPYLTRIEQAIKKSLLSPAERARVSAEFNLEGLMRADSAGRAALYASAAQNGWMTRNEIRELENREPLEGGDELTVQSNLTPLRLLGKVSDAAKAAKNAILSWLELPVLGGSDEA